MKKTMKLAMSFALAASLALPAAAQGLEQLWTDPVTIDTENPPEMAELSFMSHGAKLNGHIYMANGAGPHPTVVLLHGFPGNEKNLDLAQAMRRAGFNVLFFHYRGAWGSQGTFSFGNAIDDVESALSYLRTPEVALRYRVDPEHLSLVGHSMGGFAALMAGARDQSVVCTVGLAAANLGYPPPENAPEGAFEGFASYTDSLTMLHTESGTAVVDEIRKRAKEFDTRSHASRFSKRPVLLIAGAQDTVTRPDETHTPLVKAFEAQGDIKLSHVIMQGDHSFSWTRIELAKTTIGWLRSNCN